MEGIILGNKKSKYPIIQGGMGVGVSMHKLAGTVSKEGGIWDKNDIKKYLDIGANGVQMATRFVTTYECDASEELKNAYINSKKEDVKIINSPVGMPGRAIYNKFIKQTEQIKSKIDKCYGCIKTCNIQSTPYCITKALINSVKGNIEEGLIFCGSNVYKADRIISVHELIQELVG